MKKLYILSICLITVITVSNTSYCFDMSQVYAYPVPFKPDKHQLLNINAPAATAVKCSVFDINGDTVRTFSGKKWNGRNGKGRKVNPGLYIIKVEIDDGSGNYGKKMIRIIVQ